MVVVNKLVRGLITNQPAETIIVKSNKPAEAEKKAEAKNKKSDK